MLMSPSRSASFYCQLSCVSFVLLLTFYFTYVSLPPSSASMSLDATPAQPSAAMRRIDFEVFGKVQGVFFRKYTQEQAKSIGVRGWIRNTNKQTVQGQVEGETKKVEQMKEWLRTTGSPQSRIAKAVFSQETDIDKYSFKSFEVRS